MTPRKKIIQTLENHEYESIPREALVMEAFNADVENRENYTVPGQGWNGYAVIEQMKEEGHLAHRNDESYYIRSIPEEEGDA